MIFFLRLAAAVASVEAYFVDEGYFDEDSDYEQLVLRIFHEMRCAYGTQEVPSYWLSRYGMNEEPWWKPI